MTSSRTEKAQRKSATSKLDDATTQAVLELQKAVRAVKDLERVVVSNLSPAQQKTHRDRLEHARWHFREARLGLERLLEEDA